MEFNSLRWWLKDIVLFSPERDVSASSQTFSATKPVLFFLKQSAKYQTNKIIWSGSELRLFLIICRNEAKKHWTRLCTRATSFSSETVFKPSWCSEASTCQQPGNVTCRSWLGATLLNYSSLIIINIFGRFNINRSNLRHLSVVEKTGPEGKPRCFSPVQTGYTNPPVDSGSAPGSPQSVTPPKSSRGRQSGGT